MTGNTPVGSPVYDEVPPAFKRSSIDLTPHDRVWKTVKVLALTTGDTVADVGLLASVDHGVNLVKLQNVHGSLHIFPEDSVVRAFVRE